MLVTTYYTCSYQQLFYLDLNSNGVATDLSHIYTSLTFSRVSRDINLITCIAINSLGTVSDQSVFEIERLGRPCAPIHLQEVESGTDWSLLEWGVNKNCEDKYLYVTSFVLVYASTGGVIHSVSVAWDGKVEDVHDFNLTDLVPNTAYQVNWL